MRQVPLVLRVAVTLVVVAAAAGRPSAVAIPAVARMPADAPGTPGRNYPFFATDIVLGNFGYLEEEFSFEGHASTYSIRPAADADVLTSGTPYRSRLLVRRPATPARFNGTVVVEWLNVTNGYDTDVLWLYQKEFLIREGYAWVGVSAQTVGVSRPPNGLKVWSPSRYGRLDVDGQGKVPGDALSYDIFTQAATAVRKVPVVLGGLAARLVIAAGQSQSAGRLATYLNAIHSRELVYDAAMLTVNSTTLRTDLQIPVIKILSENEANSSRGQRDTERIRTWTVAGATHSEQYSLVSRAAFLQRDLNLPAVDACDTPARSRVEIRYVYNAAIDALVKWRQFSVAPPNAPELTFSGDVLQRDEHRNALGGVRSIEMDVPVAHDAAINCGLGGTHVPFDDETLKRLYPTHSDYVRKVRNSAASLVKAGFMLRADAEQAISRAERSIYGAGLVCGPLCSDVRQFPSHPSSMLLAKQTAHLLIKDGGALVTLVDRATSAIAEGDTLKDDPRSRKKFGEAAAHLRSYVSKTQQFLVRGHLSRETAALLIEQATTLLRLVEARTK